METYDSTTGATETECEARPVSEELLIRDPSYPSPSYLAHVSIFSGKNFSEVVKFYQVVLNMRLNYEIEGRVRLAALSLDGENHRLGIVELPTLEERPPNSVRLEHTSWQYANLKDLLAVVRHVENSLGLFPQSVHQGPLISLTYRDPDDNRVELLVECVAGQAEVTRYYIEHFAADPKFNSLLAFDLRKMIRLEEAGEPLDHLLSYDWVRDNLPDRDAKSII